MALHVGELVERYSHNRDILFRIIEIKGEIAILFGEELDWWQMRHLKI